MMERLWRDILGRFGQEVRLIRGEENVEVQAMVQPLLGREDQEAHGALGMERRERFRYLGPVRTPLDLGTVVEWKGRQLRVSSVQLVGEGVCPHWRAVLYPRDEVMG